MPSLPPPRRRPRGGLRRAALGPAVVLAVAAGVVPASATPAPVAATEVAAGEDFAVERVAGGYRVTLELDEQLPVRSAAPVLVVDGRTLGTAVETDGGRSLTLLTTDPEVAGADAVDLGWSTDAGAAEARLGALSAPSATSTRQGPVLAADPGARGRFGVVRADYDLGDDVWALEGLDASLRSEGRAAVYLPGPAATGRLPVVVLLHGRHQWCTDPVEEPDEDDWSLPSYPCAEGTEDVPSYLGYGPLAQNLASHGYAVVSVSANAVNAYDNESTLDYGAAARGDLVLHHLDALAAADRGEPGLGDATTAALRGRLDLTRVGLMGHSRGGEGVVEAALMNAARPSPYGVRAVLPLAPVDFSRPVLPEVDMAVVLPYCDGDVADLQGQHFFDDSRYTVRDDVLRSSLLVMGANHNYFNTEWNARTTTVPHSGAGDDWWDVRDSQCGTRSESRLSPREQLAVGTAYMSGFFQATLGGRTEYLPLLDGQGARAASAGRAVVHTQAQAPGSRRALLHPLDGGRTDRLQAVSGARVRACASVSDLPVPGTLPPCGPADAAARMPHWTPAVFAPSAAATPVTAMSWVRPAGAPAAQLRVGLATRDLSGYEALTFRTSPTVGVARTGDLLVTLVDGRGRGSSVRLSEVSDALVPLPAGSEPELLPKTLLRTAEVPLGRFAGVDLADVRQVRLTAASTTGSVYLSDLAAVSRGPGSGSGPTRLPQVSLDDVVVDEGAGPGTALVPVRLSAPSAVGVRVRLETTTDPFGGGAATAGTVTVPAGSTCETFAVPLAGDTRPGTQTTASYPVVAAVPAGAVTGTAHALLTVVEDDGVVVGGRPVPGVPPVGPQGDPCA